MLLDRCSIELICNYFATSSSVNNPVGEVTSGH
jgi:hypothetical protein